jgi:hypothetical protein
VRACLLILFALPITTLTAQMQSFGVCKPVVQRSEEKTWLMTIDDAKTRASPPGIHVADIGPLPVRPGTEYAATFMEATAVWGIQSRPRKPWLASGARRIVTDPVRTL